MISRIFTRDNAPSLPLHFHRPVVNVCSVVLLGGGGGEVKHSSDLNERSVRALEAFSGGRRPRLTRKSWFVRSFVRFFLWLVLVQVLDKLSLGHLLAFDCSFSPPGILFDYSAAIFDKLPFTYINESITV